MAPYAGRFSDSARKAIITFHDTKCSLDGVESRSARRNGKQLYPERFSKNSNARGMVKCNIVESKDVTRRLRKVFDDPTKRVLLYAPSVGAKLRPSNESTAAKTDEDILVLFDFDRIYNGGPASRIPIHTPTVASEESLNEWKSKPGDPVLHTDRWVPGALSLQFRWKVAVNEWSLLLRMYPSVFRTM